MADSFLQLRFRDARSRLWDWGKDHIRSSLLALIGSTLVVPLAAGGTDMKHELWLTFVYGCIGPSAIVLGAFIWFWLRSGVRLYAESQKEILELKKQLGIVPEPDTEPTPNWKFEGLVIGPLGIGTVIAIPFLCGIVAFMVTEDIRTKFETLPRLRAVISEQAATIKRLEVKHPLASHPQVPAPRVLPVRTSPQKTRAPASP